MYQNRLELSVFKVVYLNRSGYDNSWHTFINFGKNYYYKYLPAPVHAQWSKMEDDKGLTSGHVSKKNISILFIPSFKWYISRQAT